MPRNQCRRKPCPETRKSTVPKRTQEHANRADGSASRYASVKIAQGVPVTQVAAQLGYTRKSLTLDT
jgi:hypothetical protein